MTILIHTLSNINMTILIHTISNINMTILNTIQYVFLTWLFKNHIISILKLIGK